MIKVSIKKDNNLYTNIKINGHAMYDDLGKDIVCASCSSIVITTVNGILSINEGSLSYESKEGNIELVKIAKDDITQNLIQNMVNLLTELEKQYPTNIKVK